MGHRRGGGSGQSVGAWDSDTAGVAVDGPGAALAAGVHRPPESLFAGGRGPTPEGGRPQGGQLGIKMCAAVT